PGQSCAGAIEITTLPYINTINNAPYPGGQPVGSCNAAGAPEMDNALWLRWAPTTFCNALIRINATTYDGLAPIYSGPDCDNLTEITCLDEPEPWSYNLMAFPGTVYWIQIGDWGFTPGGGPTDISIECLVPTGACCHGTDCTVMTQSDCGSSAG